MVERLTAILLRTMIGPVLMVWAFGYLLVDIVAYLMGRSLLGLNFLCSLPLFALGVAQTLAVERLRETFKTKPSMLRWPSLAVALLLATSVQAAFDLYWLRWIAINMLPDWQVWALNVNLQRLMTVGILYLWTFCLSLSLVWAMHVLGAADAIAARAATAEAAAAKAEAAALRLQLNPHFMFNALNSLSSLVLVDRKDEAEEMILRLCDFLRGSLGTDPTADVPLSQEFDVIRAYVSIEAARFGDNLHVDIHMDPKLERKHVPNFILQPLVENAIKHGIAKASGTSNLVVEASSEFDELILCVENSAGENMLDREPSKARRQGIGLHNIRQRLANRYGDRARLEVGSTNGGYRAIIRLPLVSNTKANCSRVP